MTSGYDRSLLDEPIIDLDECSDTVSSQTICPPSCYPLCRPLCTPCPPKCSPSCTPQPVA
ncbi:MAG: hypothetical protein H6Q67_1992 [Firmicutes bacterium]|nr:hypothetical protein [Bacillota bacterium]